MGAEDWKRILLESVFSNNSSFYQWSSIEINLTSFILYENTGFDSFA